MGLSFGMGCAVAAKLDGSQRNAYVMVGDGEIQEGSVWEARWLQLSPRTGNLKLFVDCNGIQNDDFCELK